MHINTYLWDRKTGFGHQVFSKRPGPGDGSKFSSFHVVADSRNCAVTSTDLGSVELKRLRYIYIYDRERLLSQGCNSRRRVVSMKFKNTRKMSDELVMKLPPYWQKRYNTKKGPQPKFGTSCTKEKDVNKEMVQKNLIFTASASLPFSYVIRWSRFRCTYKLCCAET